MQDTDVHPPCEELRLARTTFVARAMDALGDDDRVVAAGFVGSLGRGTADDWSDVDLLVIVEDLALPDFGQPQAFPCFGEATLTFDARHNAPAGTHATSGQYVVDRLPIWVDWYAYPSSIATWVADSRTEFDQVGHPKIPETFDEHLAAREPQDPTPKKPDDHAMLQLALVSMAGKRVARRSPDSARMIEFLGAPAPVPESADGQVRALRAVLDSYEGRGPREAISSGHRYLDLVEAVI